MKGAGEHRGVLQMGTCSLGELYEKHMIRVRGARAEDPWRPWRDKVQARASGQLELKAQLEPGLPVDHPGDPALSSECGLPGRGPIGL